MNYRSIDSKKSASFLNFFSGATQNALPAPSWQFLKLLGYQPGDKVYVFTQPSKRVYELVLTASGFSAQLTKKLKGEDGGEDLAREPVGRVYQNGQVFLSKLTTGADPQNIFLIPNRHAGGIGTDFYKGATALFYEVDDASLSDQTENINKFIKLGLVPTAVVFSGGKSFHNYFRLSGEVTKEKWVYLQKLLIAVMHSDPAIKNVSRQMRLPGFLRPDRDLQQTLCYTSEAIYSPEDIEKILLGFLTYGLSDERWRDYVTARVRKDGSHLGILNTSESELPSVLEKRRWEERKLSRRVSLNAVSTSYSDALAEIDKNAQPGDFEALGAVPAKGAGNRCACPIHGRGSSGTSGYLKVNKGGVLALGCNAACGGLRTLTQVEKALRYGLGARIDGIEFINFAQELATKYGVTVTPTTFTRSITTPTLRLSMGGKGTLPLHPDHEQLQVLKNQSINIDVAPFRSRVEAQTVNDAIARYKEAGVKILVNGRDYRLSETDYLRTVSMRPSARYDLQFLPPGEFSKKKWEDQSVLAVQSGTGTGKTEQLKHLFNEAQSEGKRVCVLTHRQNLAKELARRTGLKYIDSRQLISGDAIGVIDSFHSEGMFDIPLPERGVLVLDEAEQFFIHAVDSSTDIKKHRCEVLKNLATFIRNLDLVALDAHLTDLTLNLIKNLKGVESDAIRYVKNNYKRSWTTYTYNSKSPDGLISKFLSKVGDLAKGRLKKKLLYLTDAQEVDSKTGTKNVASLVLKRHPNLKVLRIDKETIKQWDAAALLDEIKKNDVIICSPSIATGWDLNLKGVFDSVWGCFNGVLTVATIRQFLARLRDLDVPRHIWVNNVGIGGSSAYTINAVIKDLHESITSAVKRIGGDYESSLLTDMDDLRIYTAFTEFYAGYKARDAAERANYRSCLYEELVKDGGEVIPVEDVTDKETWSEVTDHRDNMRLKEREKILDSTLITQRLYESIKARGPSDDEEIYKLKLFELHSKYNIYPAQMNLELLEFDHDCGHIPLRNRYLLTSPTGDEQVNHHDAAILKKMRSDARFFAPDIAKKLIGEKISLLKKVGVMQLTQLPVISHIDPTCAQVADMAKRHAADLSRLFGITIHPKMPPATVCSRLLNLIGWGKGAANRFKRDGVFYSEWQVVDNAAEIPITEIFAGWETKYQNAIAEISMGSNQSNPENSSTFFSDHTESELGQGDADSIPVSKTCNTETSNHRGDAVEEITYTEKSGSKFTNIRSYITKNCNHPDGVEQHPTGGVNQIQLPPSDPAPNAGLSHAYQPGDRVYYYSPQRGGVWQAATILKILGAGLVIKMDGSILEIKVWQPQIELAPIVA